MKSILKYLLIIVWISNAHAIDKEQEMNSSSKLHLGTMSSLVASKSNNNFDSVDNYEKLTEAYYDAKTEAAVDEAKDAIYAFVEQYPEDMYSVELLKSIFMFCHTPDKTKEIYLCQKIVKLPEHPKLYEAHMILYLYGDEKDKSFAKWNFQLIAGDKSQLASMF